MVVGSIPAWGAVKTRHKIPENIRIGPIDFAVEWRESKKLDEDGLWYGDTHRIKGRIRLNPFASKSITKSTVIHETLHGCFSQTNLTISEEEEEAIIMAIEPLLVDTLIRAENQGLRDFLFGDLNADLPSKAGNS